MTDITMDCTKCEARIRKEEGDRLLNYLKGLLRSTPKASLAATIDLIETIGQALGEK